MMNAVHWTKEGWTDVMIEIVMYMKSIANIDMAALLDSTTPFWKVFILFILRK